LKKTLVFFFTLLLSGASFSQNDSCQVRISLLTCSPGEELYSTFGHTALRVVDASSGTDLVYNYGTFEFGPDFYMKFIRGKLLYFLSVEEFQDFVSVYQSESRSIQEQLLQLTCSEKIKLFNALQENAKEDNRYYKYDFLFDNCTTRAGDIVAAQTDSPVVFHNILPPVTPSFRDLIHSYLNAAHQDWSKLGIDILLGARLDRKVTNRQAMFLPDYLLKGFDSASLRQHSLASPPQTILNMPARAGVHSIFTPFLVFTTLLILILLLYYSKTRWSVSFITVFDFIFFFILGLAGILLLFMWFGTDHRVCRDNFNLFWAIPTHTIGAFFVQSRRTWVNKYFRITAWITIALLATWFFLPQQMNHALIPLVLLILFRSWDLSKKSRYVA
jgi:hypothetical protein